MFPKIEFSPHRWLGPFNAMTAPPSSVVGVVSLLLMAFPANAKAPPANFVTNAKMTGLYCEAIYLYVADLPGLSADEVAKAQSGAKAASALSMRFLDKSEAERTKAINAAVTDLKDLNFMDQAYKDMASHCDTKVSELTATILREGYDQQP